MDIETVNRLLSSRPRTVELSVLALDDEGQPYLKQGFLPVLGKTVIGSATSAFCETKSEARNEAARFQRQLRQYVHDMTMPATAGAGFAMMPPVIVFSGRATTPLTMADLVKRAEARNDAAGHPPVRGLEGHVFTDEEAGLCAEQKA